MYQRGQWKSAIRFWKNGVYETTLVDGKSFFDSLVVNDIEKFKAGSNEIFAYLFNEALKDVKEKAKTENSKIQIISFDRRTRVVFYGYKL